MLKNEKQDLAMMEHELRKVLKECAIKLGDSMIKTGWLGHWKNNSPERNTVVHLSSVLMDHGYGIWAEPILYHDKGKATGHVDLAAVKESTLLAVEVKSFGSWNWSGMKSDAVRLKDYLNRIGTAALPVAPRNTDTGGWDERINPKTTRWAVLVNQFFGNGFQQVWDDLIDRTTTRDQLQQRLGEYLARDKEDRKRGNMKEEDFLELVSLLFSSEAIFGCDHVLHGEFKNTSRLSLLWAAFKVDGPSE